MLSNRILIHMGLYLFFFTAVPYGQEPVIVNHNSVKDFSLIPQFWIQEAKHSMHIAYQHTSHGSQLVTGMRIINEYIKPGGIFMYSEGGLNGALDLDDYAMESYYSQRATDLGYYPSWIYATRNYLNAPENQDVNVIMWSWCDFHSEMVNDYLVAMEQLEVEYPNVKFVYMTGHSNGGGETGSVHTGNSKVRNYCIDHNKILYDFYDIEVYDPNDVYYGNRLVNDECDYDSNGDGVRDANWAKQWQQAHPENNAWASCYCAHSQALNCYQKGKAAWYLFARLAGWDGCLAVPGDMNGDCRIDMSDFVILCDSWLIEKKEQGWNPIADFAPANGDGIIDLQDFTALSQSWMYTHCGTYFVADFNRDCRVDMEDLSLLAVAWLSDSGQPDWDDRYDILPADGDNKVDFLDFTGLSMDWLKQ